MENETARRTGRDELLLIRQLGLKTSVPEHGRAGARPYRRKGAGGQRIQFRYVLG
jgi:hypothetical protein